MRKITMMTLLLAMVAGVARRIMTASPLRPVFSEPRQIGIRSPAGPRPREGRSLRLPAPTAAGSVYRDVVNLNHSNRFKHK
jgi:hypothetical protein